MTEHLRTEVDGGVLFVTLARPEKKNALTRAMYDALADALARLEAEPGLRCLLLRAEGDAFTAGNDISDFLHAPPTSSDAPAPRLLTALASARKPLVAAVNGTAVGIGLTLLLHCDLAYAAEGATFSAPFTRLALVPEAGSSQLLPQLLGYRRAMELFLLGRALSAAEAAASGLVNAVVAPERLDAAAREAAAGVAALPPEAVRLTKQLLRAEPEPLGARIARELAVFRVRLASPEAKEAFGAFMETRAPDFSRFA